MTVINSAAVLTAVAKLIAEEKPFGDLVSGLASELRRAVPFERLHVVRHDRAESATHYIALGSGDITVTSHRLPASGQHLLRRDPYVVHDADTEIAPDSVRGRIFRRLGVRSALRVPLALDSGVWGSLFCLGRDAGRFAEGDLDFARRVADLLALALSHQRLAEAATHVDIRVVAATNLELHGAMRRGEFREDLYYRLSVFEIALPRLRDRLEDILELADAFLEEIGGTVSKPPTGVARDAREQRLTYAWPGNVRELRNAIERAVILADGGSSGGSTCRSPFPGTDRPRPATKASARSRPAASTSTPSSDRSCSKPFNRRGTTRCAPQSCSG